MGKGRGNTDGSEMDPIQKHQKRESYTLGGEVEWLEVLKCERAPRGGGGAL